MRTNVAQRLIGLKITLSGTENLLREGQRPFLRDNEPRASCPHDVFPGEERPRVLLEPSSSPKPCFSSQKTKGQLAEGPRGAMIWRAHHRGCSAELKPAPTGEGASPTSHVSCGRPEARPTGRPALPCPALRGRAEARLTGQRERRLRFRLLSRSGAGAPRPGRGGPDRSRCRFRDQGRSA